MNPSLTQDMVDGMDDMGGMLSAHQPASRTSAFFWREQRAPSTAAPVRAKKAKKPNRTPNHITLTGREQGQRDADRNQAIRMRSI